MADIFKEFRMAENLKQNITVNEKGSAKIANCFQTIDEIASTIEKNIVDCFENNRKLMVNHAINSLTQCEDIDAAFAHNKTIITFDDILRKECHQMIDGFKERIELWKKGDAKTHQSKKQEVCTEESKKTRKKRKKYFYFDANKLVAVTQYHNNYIPVDVVKRIFEYIKLQDFLHIKSFLDSFDQNKKTKNSKENNKMFFEVKKHHAYFVVIFLKQYKFLMKNGAGIYKMKNKTLKDLNDCFVQIKK